MPDGEPEPDVEPTGMPVVALPAAEGSDPTADGGLVDAGERPLLVVVALVLQADVTTGGVVVVVTGAVVVVWRGVVLWQTGAVEPESADAAAVWVAVASLPSSHG